MTSLMGGLLVAYLLSASFVDEVQLNVTSLQRLVSYDDSLNFTQLIPGELYNGSIRADWAVPRQAIAGLDGQSVAVKITASTRPEFHNIVPVSIRHAGRRIRGIPALRR